MKYLFQSLVILLAAAMAVVVASCTSDSQTVDYPKAVKGRIDLTNWDFDCCGPLRLDGEWAFYWNQLLDPQKTAHLDSIAPSGFIKVPGAWNGYRVNDAKISGAGFATYRLRVILKNPREKLALKLLDAATSCAVYVNGQKLATMGRPGQNDSETIPGYRPQIVVFETSGPQLDIILQVANFDHWQGGVWEAVRLGLAGDLIIKRERALLFSYFMFGCILFMGLYHVVLFSLRRNDLSTLYLGVFCLFIAVRTIMTGERAVLHFIPDLDWALMNKSIYINAFISIPCFVLFARSIFPMEVHSKIAQGFFYWGVALSVFVLFTPMSVYSFTMPLFQITVAMILLYGIYVCALANIRRRDGALVFLVGFLAIFVTTFNDMLYSRQIVHTTYVFPFGLLLFMFAQTVLLARRFSKSFHTVADQGRRLEQANVILKKEIEERRRVENAYQNSEGKYRLLAENISDAIWILDIASQRFEYVSPSIRDLLGNTVDEMGELSLNDVLTPESYELARKRGEALVARAKAGSDAGPVLDSFELEACTKGGQRIWMETSIKSLRETDGAIKRLLGVARDVTKRKAIEDALRESEEKYRLLFTHAPAGIYEIDVDQVRYLSVNDVMCEYLGYTREEFLSLSPMEILTEESQKALLERMEKTHAGETMPTEQEYCVRAKDGRELWVLINTSFQYKDGRPKIATVVAHEITERKLAGESLEAALQEKEVLLKEVHHRVKNNMQVIASLLNLQADQETEERVLNALGEARDRVVAMALVHETLYGSSSLAEIDLKSYLEGLTRVLSSSHAKDSGPVDLNIQVESGLKLGLDQAVPCGLVLNELVSNAFKHAFPQGRAGEIDITARQSSPGRLTFEVADNGVGLPEGFDYRKDGSLGMMLVRTLVEKQLNGNLEIQNKSGCRFKITLPIVVS
jgi:PAS domain S-box-containing protein